MRKFFDLHNDFLTEIKKDKLKEKYLNKFSGENNIISAVWTTELSADEAMNKVEDGFNFIERNNLKIDENYSMRLHLAVEDMHFVSKSNLNHVINCCPLYCTLTWNYQNALGGGAVEGGDLTSLGAMVASELEENNIFVDTAHLSEKSFMSFSKITKRPILCSHTAVNSLCENKRNLKDYQIKMIVESGGLIGIAFVNKFLTGTNKSSTDDVTRHIDYIVSRYGDDNISLGTDFLERKRLQKESIHISISR